MNAHETLDRRRRVAEAFCKAHDALLSDHERHDFVGAAARATRRGASAARAWAERRSIPPSTVLEALEAFLRKKGVDL